MPKNQNKGQPGRKRGGGKIHLRDDFRDWQGKKYVRLDFVDRGKDLHLYVREGHELAQLQPGTRIKIVTDDE